MIRTTYLSVDTFILNDPPQWSRGYESSHESLGDQQTSLTMRETRRPYQNSLTTTIKSTSTLSGIALRTLQSELRDLKAQQTVSPFWPAASFWSNRASMKIIGGAMIAYKRDWSQFEIYVYGGTEPSWPLATDIVAPAIFGYLVKGDELKWMNVDTANWQTELAEASSFDKSLTFLSGSFTTGPTPTGYPSAPTLLPFRSDHNDLSETLSVMVKRDSVGFSRQKATTFYPHEVYRGQPARYTIQGLANISTLLNWFDTVSGDGAPFWAASSFAVGYVATASLAGDVSITLADANALRADDYVCTFVNASITTAQVSTIVGNTLTLHGAFGVALPAGQPIYALCLARLESPKMVLTWFSANSVTATIKWSEVKPETLLPGDETLGTTIGLLPMRFVLFDFYRDYGNGTVDHKRYTNHEQDVIWNGTTWASRRFGCGNIPTSLNLEDDAFDVEGFLTKFDGTLSDNPMVQEAGLTNEAPLQLKVYFSAPSSVAPLLNFDGNPLLNFDGSPLLNS